MKYSSAGPQDRLTLPIVCNMKYFVSLSRLEESDLEFYALLTSGTMVPTKALSCIALHTSWSTARELVVVDRNHRVDGIENLQVKALHIRHPFYGTSQATFDEEIRGFIVGKKSMF